MSTTVAFDELSFLVGVAQPVFPFYEEPPRLDRKST
jgi:hypothetical protein